MIFLILLFSFLARATSKMADSKRAKSKAAATASDATGASKWQKALDPTAEWEKTELHEVVYWLRQVLGVLCGVVWGVIPLTGYVGNLAFLGLSGLALFVFFAKYHRTVDPEWYWPLTQEGYLNSYAIFLVTWIIAYNAVHF